MNRTPLFLFLALQCFLTTAFVVLPQFHPQTIVSSFTRASSVLHSSSSSSSSSFSSSDHNNNDEGEKRRRLAEFLNLEPLTQSSVRKERLDRERENKIQFAKYGNELWQLRRNIESLSLKLVESISSNEDMDERGIRKALRQEEMRDPELVYKLELEAIQEARNDERADDVKYHTARALNARSCLPQFNLEGLWVGKYGNHGYEMVNVTYAGDTLIAYKVTGDANVPRGEITFQADLSPLAPKRVGSRPKREPLKPIILTEKAAKKWGTYQLPRSHGLGRVAEEGFENPQWMEGQLIIIGEEYFSFAWVPIEHQIFFGRPSPELALKMLRDGGESSLKVSAWDAPPSQDDDVTVWKDFAMSCLEKTEENIDDSMFGDEFGCIWHGADTEECYFE